MSSENVIDRREFLKTTPLVLGGIGTLARAAANESPAPRVPPVSPAPPVPSLPQTSRLLTIQDVIDLILDHANVQRIEETIDTLKVGDPGEPVRGIVTTFMATTEVIRQAIEHDANLIVTHEPTFYSHADTTDWLENDPVYRHKLGLLNEHGIAVWRYHDHLHKIVPDPIFRGLIDRLGWIDLIDPEDGRVCHVPQMLLADLAEHCKQALRVKALRYVGAPNLPCKTVGLLPGAWGGKPQIGFLAEGNIDALICGEVNEWETNEYVRDSQHTDKPLGLIVTGHQCSEEDGLKPLADWLDEQLPHVRARHLPAGDPFTHV
jgi:putative NIF3 family GTP cyclohydrolase 1 type 2